MQNFSLDFYERFMFYKLHNVSSGKMSRIFQVKIT